MSFVYRKFLNRKKSFDHVIPCDPFLQWSTLGVGGSLFDFPRQAFSIFPIVATAAVALQRRNYADDRTESRALDPRGILGSILTLDVEETCFDFLNFAFLQLGELSR